MSNPFKITHVREDALRLIMRDRCDLFASELPSHIWTVREVGENGLQIVGEKNGDHVYGTVYHWIQENEE